ncbi:MAG: DUF2058 domain-containing protein [Methylococcales bacterium]|nr:DUF2058 domain-containing protein [Methylococcales bacterium]
MKKPQTLSLQEQLLKSGLASDAKAKQVKAEKRKQTKQQRNKGIEVTDAVKLDVEQARQQQAERDRELNRLRQQAEEQKALSAQIRQMVEQNTIAQDENGMAYRFTDHNKVKSVYAAPKVREALVAGQAAIVRLDGMGYRIVSAEIARKICDRNAEYVVVFNENSGETVAVDDPYAAFQVPDDLIW